ncbi:LacI family DNA-binding transcriptional regulator [Echinicola jeungdonensis]|uniref:LacI family DNA-binding transcriptional regulator n=1 Tax=Echinicola jeungdonensis TaxID=709343 RepID=A0ABV5J9C0_9BACT|nr:LacI family DNA-binding transcriptional regulator [Echinicola jeungdonensis]MDN3670477.1 LacI family DNA-binding transcriptional regulator [Echinicola jeungdonensis]
MKKKRINIRDIAEELDVTPSTVSRALNSGKKVGEQKRKEIIELANKWGYRPNRFAKSLIENKTYNLGLLLPEFTHHFFNKVLSGIESVTYEAGYHLVICVSDQLQDKEIKSCQTFIDSQVDGVLAIIGNEGDEFGHIQEVIDAGIPLVLMDRLCEDIQATYVVTDDYEGAFNAVNHLVQTGCSRIIHLKGPDYIFTAFNRHMGYKEGLKRHGIPYRRDWVISPTEKDFAQKLEHLILKEDIDGIFAFSDYDAFGAYDIIGKTGKKIPDDIGIIGYANEPLSTYVSPKLTTVEQSPFEIGRISAGYLLQKINQPSDEIMTSCLKTKLVIRDSTRSIK